MDYEPWTKDRPGKGALIREPDGSGRLELWATDPPRDEPGMFELLGTLGDVPDLVERAEILYIKPTGHFDLIQHQYDDATKERLRALGREIERLDPRLTYNGPADTPFDGWRA